MLFSTQIQAIANCHINDWTALKALYEDTNGDNWAKRGGWSTYINGKNSPPSNCNLNSLDGVTLKNGRVVKIHIWENNMIGNLPSGDELKLLGNLKTFIITLSGLTGSLPEFKSMPNLQVLELHQNNLSGNIPWRNLYRLTKLKQLRLDHNSFSGVLPDVSSTLKNLEQLFFSHNNFTGGLPAYGRLSKLTLLAVQHNNLSGPFAPALSSLCGRITNPSYYVNKENDFDQLWSSFCSAQRKSSIENLNESDYLTQNSPNPLVGSASIEYFVPETAKTAELSFTNITGKIVKTIAINQVGAGTVNLTANELPIGVYTYTLYSNGEALASKKMIVAKQ